MNNSVIDFYGKSLKVFKSNLHTHSTVSDGKYSPQEIISMYAGQGYDVLALTDHGKFNPVESYDPCGMTLMHGIELHPHGPCGRRWHLLALGVREGDMSGAVEEVPAQDVIDSVVNAGGMVFAAHPYWCGFQHEHVASLKNISGIEVWNTSCRYIGKQYNMQIWDDLLMSDLHYTALAVDDSHKDVDLFFGWTMICAEDNSEESLLKALKTGSFYATQGPEFKKLSWKDGVLEAEFTPCADVTILSNASYGWSIRREEETGELATSFKLEIPRVLENPAAYKYLRIQLRDEKGKYAWSMPVFLQ